MGGGFYEEGASMCGIVGYLPLTDSMDKAFFSRAFDRLFRESCIRGLHAYGISSIFLDELHVLRSFKMEDIPLTFDPVCPTIAHARYCQSGDWKVLENNQPIVVGNTALAFNGCIHM